MLSQRYVRVFAQYSSKLVRSASNELQLPRLNWHLRKCIYTSSASYKLAHFAGENFSAHGTLLRTRDRYVLAGEGTLSDDLTLEQFLSTLHPPDSTSTLEVIDSFKVISDFAHMEGIEIHSNIFDKLIDVLTDKIKDMTNEQLCEIFKHLRKWPPSEFARTRNFIEIWTALDDALKNRSETLNMHELLLFMDHIYRTNLVKYFSFTKYAVGKMIRKAKTLTPAELVQVAFYAGVSRWSHDMFELEIRFFDCIDFLTLEEICIVCMGFFKTQTPLRDPHLLSVIINRLEMSKELPDSVLVTSLLKMIKYSITDESNCELEKLFNWFTTKTDEISPMGCTHLAISGTTSRLKHEKLLNQLALNFVKNSAIVRLKDLERIAGAYSLFNMQNANGIQVLEIILDELRKPERVIEFHKYPTSFVNCLMFLIIGNKFPLDMVSYALSEEFLKKHYLHHMGNGKSMHIINNSVVIEQPKWYKGPFLSEETQVRLTRKYFRYVPERGSKYKLNTEQIQVLDIMSTIAGHRGSWSYLNAMHILPHYDKGDIVICNGVNGNPIKVVNYFPKKEFGKIYHPPDKNKQWLVICPTHTNGYIWKSSEPVGLVGMRIRQLKALGYIPVLLPIAEWQTLKSTVEKVDYLKKLLLTVDFKF